MTIGVPACFLGSLAADTEETAFILQVISEGVITQRMFDERRPLQFVIGIQPKSMLAIFFVWEKTLILR